ncbi:hypothetical protein JTE90_008048 [Oedothorax gibbosus]|uniref:Uncharacterized protein n=1 Tax=Oedothorax gibbosus TaxID=931172 RepID=A0AAV6UXP9_9ARAC|nr:hypothetical protein JTE90_008048 [Oedothorax gibbosus]
MRSFMVLLFTVVLLVEYSSALGYGTEGGDIVPGYDYGMVSNSRYGGSQVGKLGNSKPTPFNMEYEAADEQGNAHYRREVGDGNGKVQGSYGYMDNQGLYRSVEYMAGPEGFTAYVKTNEPGTNGKENPADVVINVQETPAGIVEKYNRRSQNGPGFSYMGNGGSGMSMDGYSQSGQGAKSGKSGY